MSQTVADITVSPKCHNALTKVIGAKFTLDSFSIIRIKMLL